MQVLIAGGTGLIGTRLAEMLLEKGFAVSILSRKKYVSDIIKYFLWNPASGYFDDAAIRDADFIVNLSGAGIADERWSKERKETITTSRVNSGKTILYALQKNRHKVKCIVCASGVGYYPKNSAAIMTEETKPGNDFLSHVVQEWENQNMQLEHQSRAVIFRNSMVLSLKGGALKEIYFPLKFFMAPYFGSGRQAYSWIHIDDMCRMIIFALENEHVNGIYNASSPEVVSNKEFMKQLIKASGNRALLMPVPALVLKTFLGERASIVLDGISVSSEKISNAGFQFRHGNLKSALESIFKNT